MDRVSDTRFRVPVTWRPTENNHFPWAAQVDGTWWVLRLNNFPDHPLYTLFIDGNTARFDVEDFPSQWRKGDAALSKSIADAALRPVVAFVAYGSEVGQPCDNPFCCG